MVFLYIRRGDAVGGDDEMKVAHVEVVGGEEHTDVAGEDVRPGLKVFEQCIERGREEPGVLRLEHEVVVLARRQHLHEGFAAHAFFEAVLEGLAEIRLPPAEIVIDVDISTGVDSNSRLRRVCRAACSSRR